VLALASPSVSVTHEIAAAIARLARRGDLFVLAGEMGSGKTAFAQGFGRALGVTEPITSPTFTIVHSYDCGKTTLHHADLYRLERMAEVADLALGELLEADGILLVEWGDVVSAALGDHLEIRLIPDDPEHPDHRGIEIRPSGRGWTSRWANLEAALAPWRTWSPSC